jgi:uncharacterized membrane protein
MYRFDTKRTLATLGLALALAPGCSGKVTDDSKALGLGAKGSGAQGGDGTGGTGLLAGTTSGAGGSTGGGASTGGTFTGGSAGSSLIETPEGTAGGSGEGNGPRQGDGTPETCNGIDDDGNGIVDDVDVGHDGVCDCLGIGTIGELGPWSNGGGIFTSWLNARTPQGARALDDDELTADALAGLQVIVVLHVAPVAVSNGAAMTAAHHDFSDAEVSAFKDWVEQGGGVMTTIGYTSDEASEVVNVNRLLAPLGMGYSTSKLDLSGYIQDWVDHPVTMGVSNIFTDNGVEPDGPDGTTLAHDMSNRVALQVAEPAQGRVVVWGDEWMTYDSEWADITDQQVELFWLNILKWLSPPKTCQVPIPPGLVK